MIIMEQAYLHDQAGMEAAFRSYFAQVREQAAGTFNDMLAPAFVSCDFSAMTVTLRVETKPWMTNPGGILHGGIISSLLDFVMGLLCRYVSGGRMTPTVDMQVSFLRPGPTEGGLLLTARITKRGRSFCYAQSSLARETEPEKLLATAAGTYFVN